ncbi:serine hydroxymethyltransferase, partial [bacterium]|nr:serine hydroxymethyltransferase [bacterium]
VIAAKAVAFKEAMAEGFNDYQKQIVKNARALASELNKRGFRLVSGGTDTHLILLDLTNKGITGKDAEKALDAAGITVNKNAIPFDKQSPFITSGIRIGTPAVTTRVMKKPEMKLIAEMITKALTNINDTDNLKQTLLMVTSLCNQFPLYANKL